MNSIEEWDTELKKTLGNVSSTQRKYIRFLTENGQKIVRLKLEIKKLAKLFLQESENIDTYDTSNGIQEDHAIQYWIGNYKKKAAGFIGHINRFYERYIWLRILNLKINSLDIASMQNPPSPLKDPKKAKLYQTRRQWLDQEKQLDKRLMDLKHEIDRQKVRREMIRCMDYEIAWNRDWLTQHRLDDTLANVVETWTKRDSILNKSKNISKMGTPIYFVGQSRSDIRLPKRPFASKASDRSTGQTSIAALPKSRAHEKTYTANVNN